MPSKALFIFFFFQAEDGIRDDLVTGVQTCALPISPVRPETAAQANDSERRVAGVSRETAAEAPEIPAFWPNTSVWRSEERRVGEEGRSRWAPDHLKKKKNE